MKSPDRAPHAAVSAIGRTKANTKLVLSSTGKIEHAVVRVFCFSRELLAHEFLHVLGFAHNSLRLAEVRAEVRFHHRFPDDLAPEFAALLEPTQRVVSDLASGGGWRWGRIELGRLDDDASRVAEDFLTIDSAGRGRCPTRRQSRG